MKNELDKSLSNAAFEHEATVFFRQAASDPRFTWFDVPDDGLFPEIRKGDVVIVDTAQELDETGIFAVDGQLGKNVIRLQRKIMGGVIAIRDFPEKDCLDLDGEPEVLGRVVMILRSIAKVSP